MKKEEYIGQLLKKFMQAETSEQQESELADYFRRAKKIPEEWEAYKQYFKAFDSGKASFNTGHSTPILKRYWHYAVACVAAMAVCAVALRYTVYTSEGGKRLAIETPKQVQQTEARKATDTTDVKGKSITTLGARPNTSGKVCMKRSGNSTSRKASSTGYVPVPQPVAATETRHYAMTSTETRIEEPSHRRRAANIDASVAYIKSRGENLERQVLASKGYIEYNMGINKDLEQNL